MGEGSISNIIVRAPERKRSSTEHMTTLADINKTLEKQTQVLGAKQTYTSHRVDALTKSFNDFFEMVTGDEGDELEKSREESDAARVQDQVRRETTGGPGKGRFFDFDVGNFLPFLGTILGGLFKRGIPAVIAALLADEIGAKVKDLTGSDLIGNIAEWSTMGGAFGFLFGGVKGGILGAAIGAIFSEGARDKYAEILQKQFGLSAESSETGAMIAAAGLSMATLLLPKILPLLFGPAGLILLAAGGIAAAITAYNTNPKFKEAVDKGYGQISDYIDDIIGKIKEFIVGMVAKARDAVVEAGKSLLNTIGITVVTDKMAKQYAEVRPQEAAQIASTEDQMGGLIGKYGRQISSDLFVGNDEESRAAKALYDNLKKQHEALAANRTKYFQSVKRKEIAKTMPNFDSFDESSSEVPDIPNKKNKNKTLEPTKPKLLYIDEFGESVYEPVRTKTELSKPVQSQELNRILADQNRMQQGQMSTVVAPVTNNTSIGQSSTALVGSGANSFDANNPLVRRAMEAIVL